MIMKPPSKSKAQTTGAGSRTAFTLFELLTVLAILAILLGLTIPVMGRARKTARIANNTTLMREIAVGCQQFRLDNADASPSYFSARELGSSDNQTRGLSPMQSILLNLMGGIAASDSTDVNVLDNVGPTAGRTIKVNPSKLVAGESSLRPGKGSYITLPGSNLKTFDATDNDEYPRSGAAGQIGGTVLANHLRIPDLIDDFGSPILAWIEDERIRPEDATAAYALENSGDSTAANAPKARFYYASNQLYLSGQFYLKSALSTNYSLNQRLAAIGAVTGSPAFPSSNQLIGTFTQPRAARSNIILHSAGPDQIWMANDDKGGISARLSTGGAVQFPANTSNTDPMSDFDDIIVGVGN